MFILGGLYIPVEALDILVWRRQILHVIGFFGNRGNFSLLRLVATNMLVKRLGYLLVPLGSPDASSLPGHHFVRSDAEVSS